MEQQNRTITWQAPEYPYRKKTTDWYWWFVLATVGLIAVALYLKNILFAFVVGIGAFTSLLYAVRPPRTIDHEANDRGIKIEKTLYPYQTLNHFWIRDHNEENERVLLIESNKHLMPLLVIPLGNANIDELRRFLLDFMEERETEEPLGQKVMNWLGF